MSSTTTTYIINVAGNAAQQFTGITNSATAAARQTTSLQSAVSKMGTAAFHLNNIKGAVDNMSTALDAAVQPGIDLNTSITDLSAITGVTGEKLKEIEGYARESAKTFGGSAAKGVESYKLILSQLGPEIAKTPAALKAMGDSVNILSKTLGGDTVAATEVLTTAMNQYQVSLNDPLKASGEMARMMNVMAAAAKEGSAELPAIKAALENSGMAAKMAGVPFEELNASIQVLDKAGKKGAEGGVAIRNVLATLSQGRFLPDDVQKSLKIAGVDITALGDKSLSFKDRLNQLKPLLNDSALLTKLFGKENQNAAAALISGTDEIGRLTVAVSGTNSASEQAGIVMGSFKEKMDRIKSTVEDWGISLFSVAKDALPAFKIGVMALQGIVAAVTVINMGAAISQGIAAAATGIWTGAVWLLNAAFIASPIGWIVLGVAALVAGIMIAWNKFAGFRAVIITVWETIKGFGNILKEYVLDRIKGIISGVGAIGSAIAKLFKGDFSGAWESAKQGVLDLTGVSAAKKAFSSAKDLTKGIGDEFGKNLKEQREKDASKQKATQTADPAVDPGITDPVLPGSPGKEKPPPAGTSKGTSESIATGGTRNTSINITLKDLIGELNITGKNFKESATEMKDELVDNLTRVLSLAQANA